MKQGEIWQEERSVAITRYNRTTAMEQAGHRPFVIVSGNVLNKYAQVVIGFPLTTKLKNYKGNVILEPNELNGLKVKSEVLVFQIRSISKERLFKKLGEVTPKQLKQMKEGLSDVLKY